MITPPFLILSRWCGFSAWPRRHSLRLPLTAESKTALKGFADQPLPILHIFLACGLVRILLIQPQSFKTLIKIPASRTPTAAVNASPGQKMSWCTVRTFPTVDKSDWLLSSVTTSCTFWLSGQMMSGKITPSVTSLSSIGRSTCKDQSYLCVGCRVRCKVTEYIANNPYHSLAYEDIL